MARATGAGPRCTTANPAVAHTDSSPTGFNIQVGATINLDCWVAPDAATDDAYLNCTGAPAERSGANQASVLLAGWLEGRLGRIFGDDFRWGGRLALTCQAAVAPGDTLTASAVVVEQHRDHSGVERVALVLGINDACSRQVATGLATVSVPSPRLF